MHFIGSSWKALDSIRSILHSPQHVQNNVIPVIYCFLDILAIGLNRFKLPTTLSLRRHGHDGIAFLLHSCLSSCCLILFSCFSSLHLHRWDALWESAHSIFLVFPLSLFDWHCEALLVCFCSSWLLDFLPVPDITHLMCYTFLGRRTSEHWFLFRFCFHSVRSPRRLHSLFLSTCLRV